MQEADSATAPLRRLARAASMAGAQRPQVQPEARTAMVAEALVRTAPVPEPEPLPEPEPEPEPVPEPMEEPEPVAAVVPIEPAGEAPEEAPLSDEDIERILNAKPEPEPDVVQSLVDGEHEEQDTVHPEDIPDPEPLPEVFTATDRADFEETDGGRKGWKRALAGIVVLAALGAGLFFGRTMLVSVWPGAEAIYAAVGIDVHKLGAGLKLMDLRNEWTTEGGQKELVVTGVITNTSSRERPVPMLRIELRDGRDEVVQVYVYPPEKTLLEAGERLSFKALVGEVMMTARRTHVLWTDELPPDAGKGPDKPAG
ncbi:DUF3426 domain-containing protein [Shumkonia mesophila]|uniref:DUF3426 domain-containing protein n=1 Tax=Shumkonia mesophila TaxID=2838854 RepID=UPI002934EFB4|nr:DUF3426 domain-containing protein [Shumkonia mesophila]